MEAEQERKRRLEAEKRHIEQEKEKKARKLLHTAGGIWMQMISSMKL